MKGVPRTLFARMWHPLLGLLLASFVVNAVLVTATLQLGSEAQTQSRLSRIADHWAAQPPLPRSLGLDPVTVVHPSYEHLPANIRAMLGAGERGIFELGSRAQDYFVLARERSDRSVFYVVENHAEVKPGEQLQWQVLSWWLSGIVPFAALLLWFCRRMTARVAAPMQHIGQAVERRPPDSLAPLALPEGAPLELVALVRQLNHAFERTARTLDRERSFTRFASHELRTPAAVMQAAIERIESQATQAQTRALARAQRGLRDMNALIDTFLELSHEGEARTVLWPEVQIDAAWISALQRHITAGAVAPQLHVEQRACLRLRAPETLLHVLVGNLLKNAAFHGDRHSVRVVIDAAALRVENAVAEPPATAGHGLGCEIARRICERAGWQFSLAIDGGRAVATVTTVATG